MASPIAVVNDATPRAQFTGDGLTAAWSVSWPVRTSPTSSSPSARRDEPDIAYTVVPLDDDGGFTIRFDTPPLAGTLITLVRQERSSARPATGRKRQFDADTVDAEFADGVMRDQELRMRLGRTVRLPDSDPHVAASGLPIITSSIAGLVGDYDGTLNFGTDDAPALQAAIDSYSALYGGALFMLAAQPGKGFYFAGSPRCKTNVKLLFTSPVAVAPAAGPKIRGELAQVGGTAGYYLTADVTAGNFAATVDTTPSGGGAVNAHFAAGDLVYITGLLDSAGTPLEEQELIVASATTTTVTFTKAFNSAYQATYAVGAYETAWGAANKAVLRKVRTAALASSATEGTDIVAVTSPTLARVAVGDLVIVEDDSLQSDIRGSGTGRVAREMAKILAIGEGGATNVRLSRRLARTYSTSFNARLTVVTPAKGCSIQGASVTFTAAAASGTPPSFQMRWADACTIAGCGVLNLDDYGSRGNGFRIDLCHECNIAECSVTSPKYYASGEGYGIYITHSTGCDVTNSQMTGCRHSYVWFGATDCDNRDCRSTACLLSDFDFHGGDEYGCTVYNPEVTGGSVSASSTLSAFAFGNSTGLVNPRYCGVAGGTVENYQSPLGYCVRFEAGASNCFVRNTRFHNIYQALYHSDTSGFAALASTNCIFENNIIDGCADWCVYLNGGAAGSTNKTAVGMLVKGNTFRTVGKMVYVSQLDKLLLQDNTFDLITPDVSYTYAFNLADCTNLQVVRNRANGASRGIKLTTCPSALVAINVLSNQVNSTAIDWSGGGSTGAIVVGNVYLGFVATFGRDTTGGVLEWPRATAITIADDAVYKLLPLDASGRVFVFKDQNVTPRIGVAYWAGATPACASLTTNGAVAATTGVLAGTTGTDGNLTVSAANDGYVYVENRSGGSLDISVIWDA
jgi:hypothetical protein